MKPFQKIFIEITNFCGLSCSFCTPQKAKDSMNLEDFNRICTEISPFTHLCALHILGDPLTLDDLNSYLKIAESYNLKIDITTSGFYCSDAKTNLLLKSPCIHQINISLTSMLYQKRQVALESYLKPIFTLLSQHQQSKSEKFINLRLWNLTKDFTPPPQNTAIYKALEEFFKTPITTPKTRLAYKIHLLEQPFFKWASLDSKPLAQKGFCYGGSKQLGILCNGDVVPCCFDTKGVIKLGNLFKDSMPIILESPRLKRLVAGFKDGVILENLCQHCSHPSYLATLNRFYAHTNPIKDSTKFNGENGGIL